MGNALGWRNIKQRPGCSEHQIDEHWWFAINPHGERCPANHRDPPGPWVPPYAIYVEYDGLPYCMVDADGAMRGPITEGPVDEDELLDAVEAAILVLRKGSNEP